MWGEANNSVYYNYDELIIMLQLAAVWVISSLMLVPLTELVNDSR